MFGNPDRNAIRTSALGVLDGRPGLRAEGNVLASASIGVPIGEFKVLILLSGNLDMIDRERLVRAGEAWV